jgi:hypothetical protein
MKKIIVPAEQAKRDLQNNTVLDRINPQWKSVKASKAFILKGDFGGRYELHAKKGESVCFLTLSR